MTPPPLKHMAIRASAGSGKTFQLSHRYLGLLARGVSPDRITALTFSRKAAGEIFDNIVEHLRSAASSEDVARETGERIGLPRLGVDDFRRMLRQLLDQLHRLHVGTLDSFTVSVIRAFPLELGVTSDFQVMDNEGADARRVREEVLQRIYSHPAVSEASRREFLEAFKLATFGQEEKNLMQRLDRFIGEYRTAYRALPDAACWGNPAKIWPTAPSWLTPVDDPGRLASELMGHVRAAGWPDGAVERWQVFAELAGTFGDQVPWNDALGYMFPRLAPVVSDLRAGAAEIKLGRAMYTLGPDICRCALGLVDWVMHVELSRALKTSEGIFRVLDQFEAIYDGAAVGRGCLTFDDIQFLLTDVSHHGHGRTMTRQMDQPTKLYIDYRLDCQLDHWLLDEFQDTSDLQWHALQNLADEILQVNDGTRSFFYVGDVKQAIYGWRGGNAGLFERILNQYGDRIETLPLDVSYRSCPPVIDTLNDVFDALPRDALPEKACQAWAEIWRQHACAGHLAEQSGYTAILEPPCDGGGVKPGEDDRLRLVAGLIRELDPIRRGLSVAVLVRTNLAGRKVVDRLRHECPGLSVIHEGNAPLLDNPVVTVLLALATLAEHPGDTKAWRIVQMSPLIGVLEARGLSRDSLSLQLLITIHTHGFRQLVREWGGALASVCPLDAFGRLRLVDLIDAAGSFDENGSRSARDFVAAIEGREIREAGVEDVVRVMTIHQSKGLGFDVVILPELMGGSMTSGRAQAYMCGTDPTTGSPDWVLKSPRRPVAQEDPVLAENLRAAADTACFDELCVLYVAMTRAKRALYMVSAYPGKTSKALTAAAFLKQQLVGEMKPVAGVEVEISGVPGTQLYSCGDPDWYRAEALQDSVPPPPTRDLPEDFVEQPSRRERLVRVSPSLQDESEQSAARLFAAESRDILDFGQAIHSLFESVTWLEDADVDAIISAWLAVSHDTEAVRRDVCEQFREAIVKPDVVRVLSRAGNDGELWRERRFEVVLQGRWITGAFDRVVVERSGDGAATAATITDYKSNQVFTEDACRKTAEKYRPQLGLYADALSSMLDLDASRIKQQLVFTKSGRVVAL